MLKKNENARILIADDHPVFREGLAAVLDKEDNLEIVGEASDGYEVLSLIGETSPDLVVLDVSMPRFDGIKTARAMNERGFDVKKVFLTLHKERRILNLLDELCVDGYVLKDSASSEIVDCINKVLEGRKTVGAALQDYSGVAHEGRSHEQSLSVTDRLTPSELRILRLISESRTNREISEELFVSVRTIETHRYNICSKLDLAGPHSLVKFAIKNKDRISSLLVD